jgi:hypothetical protein
MHPELAAVIGVTSAIVGACVQYLLGRLSKREGARIDQKLSAYTDYLKSQYEAYSEFLQGDESDEKFTAFCIAKARLVMYANKSVIAALAEYEYLGGIAVTDKQKDAFVVLLNEMRRDCGAEPLNRQDILQIQLSESQDTNA